MKKQKNTKRSLHEPIFKVNPPKINFAMAQEEERLFDEMVQTDDASLGKIYANKFPQRFQKKPQYRLQSLTNKNDLQSYQTNNNGGIGYNQPSDAENLYQEKSNTLMQSAIMAAKNKQNYVQGSPQKQLILSKDQVAALEVAKSAQNSTKSFSNYRIEKLIEELEKSEPLFERKQQVIVESSQFNDKGLNTTKNLKKYDCFDDDHTPQEWVEICKQSAGPHAKTLFYDNKQYHWVPVYVLDYDPAQEKYLIKLADSGIEKYVGRLSLLFNNEDTDKFHERLNLAKSRQQVAENELRFWKYIEQIPNEIVSVMQTQTRVNIINKAIKMKMETQEEELQIKKTARSLLDNIEYLYLIYMKKCAVLKEMESNQNEGKFKKMRIKIRKPVIDIPFLGTICKFQYLQFNRTSDELQKIHISAKNQVVITMNMITTRTQDFLQFKLFKTDLNAKTLPMTLVNFEQLQKTIHNQQKNALLMQWREYICTEIQDILGNVPGFSFYQTDPNTYQTSELQKLLRRIDFMFNTYLRIIVDENVNNWSNFIRKFTFPELNEIQNIWQITEYPLLKLNLNVNVADKKKKKNKKDNQLQKQATQEIDEDQLLFYEPSLQQIQDILTQPFEMLVQATNSFQILEKGLVPLCDVKPKLAFNIEDDMHIINDGKAKVLDYIKKGFEEPQNILNEFKKYEFLIERTTRQIHKTYFSEKQKDIEEQDKDLIEKGLDTYEQAKYEVQKLCIDQKKCRFFLVNTQQAKKTLIDKTNEIIKSILNKISELCHENVQNIANTYQEMIKNIGMVPSDEKELVKLKDFIQAHDVELFKLNNKVNRVNAFLTILENNCEKYDDLKLNEFWLLKTQPAEIKGKVLEAQRIVEQQESKFKDKLENEKDVFSKTLAELAQKIEAVKKFNNYKNVKKNFNEDIIQVRDKIQEAQETVKSFNEREELFKQEATAYEELKQMIDDFEPFSNLWETAYHFYQDKQEWDRSTPFIRLSFAQVSKEIDKFWKDTVKYQKYFSDNQEENALTVARTLKENLAEFKKTMWLIEELTREAFQKRPGIYWKEIYKECGNQPYKEVNDDLHLEYLINDMHLLDYREQIQTVAAKAEKEWNLEKKYLEILEFLKTIKLDVIPHKDTKNLPGYYILKGLDEVQQQLDDQLNMVQMMMSSPYIKRNIKKVKELESRLQLIQETLEGWIKCQRGWIHLQPVFSSEDIKERLANEKMKFDSVNNFWFDIMEKINKDPYIYEFIDNDTYKTKFNDYNRTLDTIQKSLSEYLDQKRKYFARFFFLSDEQLLQIIAETKDPLVVQKHINKCFEAINLLKFEKDEIVTGMISPEREEVDFLKQINVNEGEKKGNVEKWLLEIEEMMKITLQDITKRSLMDTQARTKWVRSWPAQVVLAVNQTRWTQGSETALIKVKKDNEALTDYLEFLNEQLKDIVKLVRGELTNQERMLMSALVTIDVHCKDIIADLIKLNVQQINDFNWLSQMRYYYEEDQKKKGAFHLIVKMINAVQQYGYEYLGNSFRLVITPLTDRCYRTLMGAYNLFYGGAPEGPAGTGKTESVKDLGKAIAMQCVVFNCSDGLNYKAMAKFFKGLASSGAWCCFDEFNRIDLEVLSVIAQQVVTIQNAIKARQKTFDFEGDNINLVLSCAINITMNPGYAGRSELPDNLKALFRTCAMMVPDYNLIAEIYLYSVGFEDARKLSKKLVASLRLSSEQLSTQDHYDFGMRAVKSILTAAGQLKRKFSDTEEDIIMLRALLDVNLPKFTMNDIPLFNSITSDLFPGIKMPDRDYGNLQVELEQCCTKSNLIPEKEFLNKCIQLYDTVMVRHGLMLVGEAFSGKSKVIEILAKAMTALKDHGESKVKYIKLNPKAITMNQLYGIFDQDTQQWTDGVLPIIMRECAEDYANPERKWVVFDGPVDAKWIESMNTVLDDNKKLCLTSGETIKMTDYMTMMFEVEDLVYASPATVSRCGMVFLESKNLGWDAVIKAYFNQFFFFEKLFEQVKNLARYLTDVCIAFMRKFAKYPMQMSELSMCSQMLKIFNTYLLPYKEVEGEEKPIIPKDIEDYVINYLMFSVIWSYGASLEESARPKFKDLIFEVVAGENVAEKYKLDLELNLEVKPLNSFIKLNDQNPYEIFFDKNKKVWLKWIQHIPPFQVPKDIAYHELMIPTDDSVRNQYFLDLCITNRLHYLITGPTGTGKTVNIVQELNKNYTQCDGTFLLTAMSGQTQSNQIQKTIEAKVNSKKRKGVFGPEDQKKFIVIFIDDVNMPIKEEYGAQPPIEILRQWLDTGGWYDVFETFEWKHLQDIIFVNAMGPPSQGRNSITLRYSRHFLIHYAQPFETESLEKIFSAVLDWYFKNLSKTPSKAITNLSNNLISSTIILYNQIKTSKELLPTPTKSHYIYNLRDISKIFQGISKTNINSYNDENDFLKLWAHECLRVFQDRLIDEKDRTYFEKMIKQIINQNFKREWNSFVDVEPLIWASFVPCVYPDGDTTKRPLTDVYCEIKDHKKLKDKCNEFLAEFNDSYPSAKMDLVLFMNALEHIVKIVRIITTTYGHALLVGVGGSGRKSLATLSCYIADYDIQTVDSKNWIEELQRVMKIAGLEYATQDRSVVFLFSDTQVQGEEQLEDICNILNNGVVPNLFQQEERGKIIEEIGDLFQKFTGTPNQKFGLFESTCKDKLHMIMTMSPVGEQFRKRIRTFPGLVNCTTIDWFLQWPEEALRSTAQAQIEEKLSDVPRETQLGLVDICVDMQTRVRQLSLRYLEELRRHFYVTPTSYLELLSTIANLYKRQKDQVKSQIKRYEGGLQKILDSEKKVSEMKVKVEELKPQLEVSKIKNKEMLKNLKIKEKEASDKRKICEKDEADTNIQRELADKLAKECQADLDEVLPILYEAQANLQKIKKSDITFIKSLPNPPINACYLMQGLVIILQEDSKVNSKPKEIGGPENIQAFWDHAKKFLLNDKLLGKLQSFDETTIRELPKPKIEKMKILIAKEEFADENMKKISPEAGIMASFVKAIVRTYGALLVVDPKRKELVEAQKQLKAAEDLLAEKKASLQSVIDLLNKLQEDYQQAQKEKEDLQANLDKCQKQMERAASLLQGLESEKKNWGDNALRFKEDSNYIIGDVMLSSGMISYLGAFKSSYREESISKWKELLKTYKIPVNENYSFQKTLSNDIKIGNWTQQKLPNDSFSIDNAIILEYSKRWPLMIDPQLQANIWIKEKVKAERKGQNLKILKPNSSENIMLILESAIQYGTPILLENLGEEIEQYYEPVLKKILVKQGGSLKMKLGDKSIDYNDEFQFYMTTKLSNPHYSPETTVQVTLLNFMVTSEGLEDQMLNIVVKKEEPERDEARQKMIKEFFENKAKQKKTEDTILQLLNDAGDDILDRDDIIQTLIRSKTESNEIEERIKKSDRERIKFNELRKSYQDCAKRSVVLFFVLLDLAQIEPMYQFSLESFIDLFERSVDQSERNSELTRSSQILAKNTEMFYQYVIRSLLEKDKLIFSFLICMNLLEKERSMINSQEIRFLMVGGTATDSSRQNPSNGWMSSKQWGSLIELSENIEAFKGLDRDIERDISPWEGIFNSHSPHDYTKTKWPEQWTKKLNKFQRLLIIRIIRPDKISQAIQDLIVSEMSEVFVERPPFNLEVAYEDSTPKTPFIFILSSGADPRQQLVSLADKRAAILVPMSLGQGQGAAAEQAIREAKIDGKWIFLQNCHLAPSWMPSLEKIHEENQDDDTIHGDFRLWLTSMPTPDFPVSILQRGIKLTYEPPKGIKNSLMRSYLGQDNKSFESHSKPLPWKKLLFSLSFFHASVLERRKFGPLGWNIPYQFSNEDLTISIAQLRQFLEEYDDIPWSALNYMVAEANYGGRVTDDKDRRLIKTILLDYYNLNVLKDGYKYSTSKVYYCPKEGTLESFKEYIRELPLNDIPEIFGMHDNAEITGAIYETNELCSVILQLLPRSTGGSGKKPEDIIKELCLNIMNRLPKKFNLEMALKIHPITPENSMNTVLNQELMRFNKLLQTIYNSLDQLQKAIDGLVPMSNDLDQVFNQLYNNKIPSIWLKFSYPSLKPLGSYVNDFIKRMQFMQKWIDEGAPTNYWISGFYFTQSFLTGTLQNYARKFSIPIDTLVFDFLIIQKDDPKYDLTKAPADGCYIYGLFLDGARWDLDKNILTEPLPKILNCEMPYIMLQPIESKKQNEAELAKRYECPVYKTSERRGTLSTTGHSTNFVFMVHLPLAPNVSPDHWIKRGVALLTQLDD